MQFLEASEFQRTPFVLNLRTPSAVLHGPTDLDQKNAVGAEVPSLCVPDERMEELTADYVRWRKVPSSAGTRGFQRRALKKASAVALSLRSTRFLLGLLFALGYDTDKNYQISLDLFGTDKIMTCVLAVIEGRKTKGHRKYQVYLELRHIVHYGYDRARRDLALLEQAALTLQSLPAFQAVDGAISAAASAKKLDDRKNLGRSEEDLVKEGRWLSENDRLLLDKGVVDFLQNAVKDAETPPDALEFQNHLIVHWLNGNSVPVLRSEIFCQLQVGRSIRKSDAGQWLIEFTGEDVAKSKTQSQLLVKIPSTDVSFVEAWLSKFRPRLVKETAEHDYFFVKRDGTGPRVDIAYGARQVMKKYIKSTVSPHVFRAMQATESKEAGISKQEHKAMCAGRQHSTSTCERFYERQNLKRSADQAADHLAQLRESRHQKRVKTEASVKCETKSEAESELEFDRHLGGAAKSSASAWSSSSSSGFGSSSGASSSSSSSLRKAAAAAPVKQEVIDLT